MYIKRFSGMDRVFHVVLMLTFLVQAATGFGRTYAGTDWGKQLCNIFGGLRACGKIHGWVGFLMVLGFVVHISYMLTRVNWFNLREAIFGPDSLVPNLRDLRQLWQRIRWSIGLGSPPALDRWSYWEKFDYWAVFWGLPILAITGIMLMYPVESSLIVPGWTLNIAALLHKAEAILAVSYICIIHFFVVHLRPSAFPMNEVMLSGLVPLRRVIEERPAWVKRLEAQGKLEKGTGNPPSLIFRCIYYLFGYSAMAFGLYLLINGIIIGPSASLH